MIQPDPGAPHGRALRDTWRRPRLDRRAMLLPPFHEHPVRRVWSNKIFDGSDIFDRSVKRTIKPCRRMQDQRSVLETENRHSDRKRNYAHHCYGSAIHDPNRFGNRLEDIQRGVDRIDFQITLPDKTERAPSEMAVKHTLFHYVPGSVARGQ